MDPLTFSAVITNINAMGTFLKGGLAIRDEATRAEAIGLLSAAQGELLSVQEKCMSIQQENVELRSRLAEFEGWEDTKSQYEFVGLTTVANFPRLKNPSGNRSIPLNVCPQCFSGKVLSPINRLSTRDDRVKCFRCNWEVRAGNIGVLENLFRYQQVGQ